MHCCFSFEKLKADNTLNYFPTFDCNLIKANNNALTREVLPEVFPYLWLVDVLVLEVRVKLWLTKVRLVLIPRRYGSVPIHIRLEETKNGPISDVPVRRGTIFHSFTLKREINFVSRPTPSSWLCHFPCIRNCPLLGDFGGYQYFSHFP
jgi:hypothetical protein